MRGRKPTKTAMTASTAPGIGDPPKWLGKAERAKWSEVVAKLRGVGILAVSDSDALALYCKTWGNWRDLQASLAELGAGTPEGLKIGNAIHRTTNTLNRLQGELGLNPTSRARLKIGDAEGSGDDLDRFLKAPRDKAKV